MSIRKVNLSDLAGQLSSRGKPPFQDPELFEALSEMLLDGEGFIWETAKVTGKTDQEVTASKAKWRNRAVSVFTQLDSKTEITIRWTHDNEMYISPK